MLNVPFSLCPSYGTDWDIEYLWRWTGFLERSVLFALALMAVSIPLTLTRVSYCYYSARREKPVEIGSKKFQRARKKLVADLNLWVSGLKSIAHTAPFLGLAGTCFGISEIFRPIAMERNAVIAMWTLEITASLLAPAAGLLVAIPAVWSYNFLRVRIRLLEAEIYSDVSERRKRHFQVAQELPLCNRFSRLPVYPLIAVPSMAIALMFFIGHAHPKHMGLPVGIASTSNEYDSNERPIILRVAKGNELFLNNEKEEWGSLAGRLSEIYAMRAHHTLYFTADHDASFQTVADAIAIAENVTGLRSEGSLKIEVRLITPGAPKSPRPPTIALTERGLTK
jgi:biopolymer transport protein ExbD